MAKLLEYVDELVQEVGPRPAGTQQEHQAAELIASRLDEFGLNVEIEEFPCARNIGWVRVLYYALCSVGAAIMVFSPGLHVVGATATIVGALLMILDNVGKNPLVSLMSTSLSQNVIARYEPNGTQTNTSRSSKKIVIMAHYDSPKARVQAAPFLVEHSSLLRNIICYGIILLMILALLLLLPLPSLVTTIISVLAAVVSLTALVPLIMEIINFFLPYNQGANCNGSGIGVMYGVARALTLGNAEARARAGESRSRAAVGRGEAGEKGLGRATSERNADRATRRVPGEAFVGASAATAISAAGVSAPSAGAGVGALVGDTMDMGAQVLHDENFLGRSAFETSGKAIQSPFITQRPALNRESEQPIPLEEDDSEYMRDTHASREGNYVRKRAATPQAQFSQASALSLDDSSESKTADDSAVVTTDPALAGKPDWFIKAKLKAEKKLAAAESGTADKDGDIVRSQFADMPISGRAEHEAPNEEEFKVERSQFAEPILKPHVSQAAEIAHPVEVVPPAELAPTASVALPTEDAFATDASFPKKEEYQELGTPLEAHSLLNTEQYDVLQPTIKRRDPAPLSMDPDFSGLDRQAFKVLAGEKGKGTAIVPTEEGSQTSSHEDPQATLQASAHEVPQAFLQEAPHETLQPQPQSGLRSRLQSLPNLALDGRGNSPLQQATLDDELVAKEEIFSADNTVVSSTGAFVPLGTTGAMKPVGEDLLDYNDGKEIFIEDADDTSIAEHYTKGGEYSEPEMVRIPNSRVKSFFSSVGDRLSGKKKEKLDNSPSSWLGVDERFDARKEGHQIGSWENFNEDDDLGDGWKGGAFGGASYADNVNAMMAGSNVLLDKEVWLVALGASQSNNVGAIDLLVKHKKELKNALFINLLGVGAGDLVFTISEGSFRQNQTDHRLQNLISGAAQEMAIPIKPVKFNALNTDGTEALKRGSRAISVMGLGKHAPLGWGWSNDDMTRLKENSMTDATNLILEAIKNS